MTNRNVRRVQREILFGCGFRGEAIREIYWHSGRAFETDRRKYAPAWMLAAWDNGHRARGLVRELNAALDDLERRIDRRLIQGDNPAAPPPLGLLSASEEGGE